jgi:hypothetical protein
MTNADEVVYCTLTCDQQSGEGMVYVKADLFMMNDVTRIDLVQDWVVHLEGVLETMRKANEWEAQELRQKAKAKGGKK